MNHQPEETSWRQRLGAGLTALAEAEAPPVTVTVGDVIEAGRREIRRRRKRTAFALSAVLISATALSFGALAVANHGGGASTPVDDPTAAASSSSHAGADPAAPIIAFGWLPASLNGEYEVDQGATGPHDIGLRASSVQVDGPGGANLIADVSDAGSGTQSHPAFPPAGTVQGHEAWWATGAPGSKQAETSGDLELIWNYEPNAWATVTYHGDTGAASGTMALKVANGLVIGPANPTALPFRLKALPTGMQLGGVNIDLPKQHGAQVGEASLQLCVVNPCGESGGLVVTQQSMTWINSSMLGVEAAPLPYQIGGGPGTAVTINGRSARLWTNSQGATVYFVYGKAVVTISAAGAEYKALGGSGFLAFCRSLAFLGANPADWTTDVIGG